MRQFTYLLFITLTLFQIISCKNDETSDNEITIYYKSKDITILDDVEETEAIFTATTDWYISIDEDYSSWLSTNVVAGLSGSNKITILTKPNETFDSRTGYVTVCGTNQQSSITITQKGKQIITFNDPVFEAYCIENFDTDTSGYVTTAEAHKATELICPSMGISDFAGIEFFTGITKADLSGNEQQTLSVTECVGLNQLDVSNCTNMFGLEMGNNLHKLTILNCSNCNLSSLTVDSCALLADLSCYNNKIPSLNLTYNSSLKNLRCKGNPDLTTVFILEGQEIEHVEKDDFTKLVYPNEIVNIPDEIFKSYLIEEFDRNRDKKISVEEAMDAEIIRCFGKEGNIRDIRTLEGIEYFPNIVYLDCSYTSITSLDLTCNPKLENVICASTKLEDIIISPFSPLELFDCSYCENLTYLSLNKNSHLEVLRANNCNLESIDFDFCSSLEDINLESNKLNSIYFTNTTSLNYLNCSNNQISSITVDNCDSLANVFCQNNLISSLDICPEKIRELDCSNNKIEGEFDLTKYVSLHNIVCDTNEITNIKLPSKDSTLISVSFNKNKIDKIDVRDLPEIKYIYATDNLLSTIRTDYCAKLEKVIINNNQLKDTVDFSTNRKLKQVWLKGNPDLKVIIGPKGVTPLDISHDDTAVVEYK